MTFRDPIYLLLVIIYLAIVLIREKLSSRDRPAVLFPDHSTVDAINHTSLRVFLASKLHYLPSFAVIMLLIGMARPQMPLDIQIEKEGIAIVLVVDCSSTMLAEDMSHKATRIKRLDDTSDSKKDLSRLDAVKEVARDFISKRKNDWVGMVGFAAEAYIVAPLTFDKKWLAKSVDKLKVGFIKDGTAIGSGIMCALNTLKNAKATSKVIVLLSDGVNNAGTVPPMLAAETAKSMGVKIYCIGMSSDGSSKFPEKSADGKTVYKNVTIAMNEKMLTNIAELTGGEYYRVSNIPSLKKSYETIDQLERTDINDD
ncbi:MAG TPA: VWA domain-containing protein, partial [Candidatus Omnitrophota bacterium]|nr:VWA domain-containing protein [Candidatus Omnitrophota bacterium]